jgi:hypothetical protein
MIDLTGRLLDITRDYRTRKPVIAFEVNEELESLLDLKGSQVSLKVAQKREHRSLDSNAYFHVLCDKLRQALGISATACKNHLIASYGQMEYIGDEPIVYKTNAPEEYMIEREEVHTKLVRIGEENDKPIYFYRIYRGSHTYNSAEMAKLIEGTIAECKQQGIETATPDELAHMANLWERRRK